jgi:hypothetical protein
MPAITEFHIQRAVCIYLDAHKFPDVLYWHTPNGGNRDPREGKRLKEMGVKAGIPDLFFVRAGRMYALELKDESGRLSAAQVDMLAQLTAAGVQTAVANSLAAAKQQIFTWGLTVNAN